MITHQVTLTTGIALTGALLRRTVVTILAAPSYQGAAPLIPWIALAQGLTGLYLIPMNGATMGAGKTGFVWVVSGFAAATNVVLLLLVVPSHGILAGRDCVRRHRACPGRRDLDLRAGSAQPEHIRMAGAPARAGGRRDFIAGAAITSPGTSIGAGVERLAWLAIFAAVSFALTRLGRRGAGIIMHTVVTNTRAGATEGIAGEPLTVNGAEARVPSA